MKRIRFLGGKSCLIALTLLLVITFCGISTAAENASEDAKKYICQGKNEGVYWPTKEWRTAKPEEVGMNSEKLVKAIEYAANPQYKTDGVAIIKNGYIVAEAYLGEFGKDTKHVSHSMAKSFTSALVGIAIDKGLIPGVDTKLSQYFHEWASDDDKGFGVGKSGFSERSEEKGDIWGLTVLPEKNRVPQSVQYFLVDALGLDFMRNTYTAKYYKGNSIVSIFLSQQDSPESAHKTIAKFKEHANLYGKGVDILSVDGVELVSCDMDGSYDVVFQKGRLVAGATAVKDKKLAVEATIDLWKELQIE